MLTQYYTYDDVLIKPKYSEVLSRKKVNLNSRLTNNINLKVPIISSNMDTITEDKMAIAMAKCGGLGIIHRYCSIEEQCNMVKRVKRYTNHIIRNPQSIHENVSISEAYEVFKQKKVGSLLVVDIYNKLVGILTNRDMNKYALSIDSLEETVSSQDIVNNYMTMFEDIIVYTINNNEEEMPINIDESYILQLCLYNKIEQVPIINESNDIMGLITLKDMIYRNNLKSSTFNLDENKQLVVGAAVGVVGDYIERTRGLIEAGVNIICIDIAHGHHVICGKAIYEIREVFSDIEIIAGNVCTYEGVEYLAKMGANCVKVGIGPGSICITRKQTGCGAPQLSSVLDCAKAAKKYGVTIIADGGHNGSSGNIFKALCAGASASMLGGMLSGTLETPGEVYTKLNKKVKQIRGMAGIISNYRKNKKTGGDTKHLEDMTPEGVEGYVDFKGPVADIINQISGGIRSGLSYVGCYSLEELKTIKIEFILVSNSGLRESGAHNINQI